MFWWLLRMISEIVGSSWENLETQNATWMAYIILFWSPKARNLIIGITMNYERTLAKGTSNLFTWFAFLIFTGNKQGYKEKKKEKILAILGDNRRHKECNLQSSAHVPWKSTVPLYEVTKKSHKYHGSTPKARKTGLNVPKAACILNGSSLLGH